MTSIYFRLYYFNIRAKDSNTFFIKKLFQNYVIMNQ